MKPRKKHGFLVFLLILAILAGLVYGAYWGINKYAPDSIAADIANQMNSGTIGGDELTKLSKEYSRMAEILPLIDEYGDLNNKLERFRIKDFFQIFI